MLLQSGTGSLDGDIVRFADAAAFERAAQLLVDRGVLHLVAKQLPPSLQSFPLRIIFPDTTTVPIQARLQTLKGLEVVVQMVEGREAFSTAWKNARKREPGAERRRAHRKRVVHRVRIGNAPCTTFDISKSGMCLVSESAPAIGTVLDGQIEIDGAWVDFQAEVRWSRLNGPSEKGRENLGVRFVRVPEGYDRLVATSEPKRTPVAPPAAARAAAPVVAATNPSTPPRRNTPRGEERRRRQRFRHRFRVAIANARGFTINVSNEGFALETHRMLVPGSEVSGTLYVDTQEIAFTGQVRWARAGNQALGILGQMGVQFRRVPLALLELLARK